MMEKPKFGPDPRNKNRYIRQEGRNEEGRMSRLWRYLTGKEEKVKKEIDEKKGGMSRRTFLKFGAALGFGIAAGTFLRKEDNDASGSSENNQGEMERKKELKKHSLKDVRMEEDERELTVKEYIPGEDKKAAHKILGEYSSGHVVLNEKTKQATESYWYFKYKDDPRMRESFENAYSAMQPHVPQLKQIFKEEWKDLIDGGKVDAMTCENLVYLAIPESHWQWKRPQDISPKGARGPYQIIGKTATDYGMKVDNGVDERDNPLISGRIAARILRDNFQKTRDMDMAISWYNGGFMGGYVRECHDEKKGYSYLGFLKYTEGKVNELKDDLTSRLEWPHAVKQGESLPSVAEKYGLSAETIAKTNNLKKKFKNRKDKDGYYMIYIGQVLKIPISDKKAGNKADNKVYNKVKEIIYENKIGGYVENLNYPGKYNAIMNIIKEKELEERARRKLEKIETAKK